LPADREDLEMDGIWPPPGWSPDGDVDDSGGTECWDGNEDYKQGGQRRERPPLMEPPPRSPRQAVWEETLACVVAGNVRLEAARVGVSQADLAQILGMSRSAVSLRHTGKVAWRVDELERVAWYLNFPVTDLLEKPKKAHRVRSW